MAKTKTKKVATPEALAASMFVQLVKLDAQIEEKRKQAGLPALETKRDGLKGALTEIMVGAGMQRVGVDDKYATLIRSTYGGMFIATSDDFRLLDIIPTDREVTPLREIIKRRFGKYGAGTKASEVWNSVTRRVVDKDALEEAVAAGVLTADEIAPSYIEKEKKPYVRIFG